MLLVLITTVVALFMLASLELDECLAGFVVRADAFGPAFIPILAVLADMRIVMDAEPWAGDVAPIERFT